MRCLLPLLASIAFAQGTDPKPKPDDYPVQAQVQILGNPVALGAEFMVHSFSRGEEAYIAPDFLVVEVALYPPKGVTIPVSPSQFTLRVNGKKPLAAQPPGLVASSLSHPEWQSRPRFEAGGGMGGIGVGTGQPRPVDFPGQTPQPGSRLPSPPKDDPSGGLAQRERVSPQQLVADTALPQGEIHAPLSGFLYFNYKGKISSIKSLELLYEDTVIRLR